MEGGREGNKNPTFQIDEWEPVCYLQILSAVIDFACYGYHIVTLKHSLFLYFPAPRLVTENGMFKSFYSVKQIQKPKGFNESEISTNSVVKRPLLS